MATILTTTDAAKAFAWKHWRALNQNDRSETPDELWENLGEAHRKAYVAGVLAVFRPMST